MVQNYYLSKYTTVSGSGCKIICAPHAASEYLLAAAAEISIAQPLHLLDFGNRCDMYFAARQLRALTRDPAAAMKNIRLQRAFTCYQALSLLKQMEQMEPGLPVFILDLLAPFLDENIRTAEISRLFRDTVAILHSTMAVRPLLIGVKPVPAHLAPDRVCLQDDLARNFDMIAVRRMGPGPENADPAAGYQMRPASRAFFSGHGSSADQKPPELMSGQPSLFDLSSCWGSGTAPGTE